MTVVVIQLLIIIFEWRSYLQRRTLTITSVFLRTSQVAQLSWTSARATTYCGRLERYRLPAKRWQLVTTLWVLPASLRCAFLLSLRDVSLLLALLFAEVNTYKIKLENCSWPRLMIQKQCVQYVLHNPSQDLHRLSTQAGNIFGMLSLG